MLFFRRLATCLLAVLQLAPLLAAQEQPQLSGLFPAGGQAGTSVEVVASGKFPSWPVQIWSDCPEIEWSCAAEAGKLQAKVAENAQPGLKWVRLFNAAGASDVRPFLVGTYPQSIEKEPNERIADGHPIASLPATLFGVLNKNADVDVVAVTLAANQWLVATIDSAKWLNSPADVSLQILDSRGFVIAENLDHVGLDPYLEYQPPQAGKFFVRVFGFPATPNSTIAFSGGSDWVYRLRLSDQPQPLATALDFDNQAELAAAHSEIAQAAHTALDRAYALSLPAQIAGVVSQPKETIYLRFPARGGGQYRVGLLARQFGSPLDATLAILDSSGKQLTQQDDVAQDRDPVLNWKAPSDGDFVIAVTDFHRQGGPGYRFLLNLEERTPDFSVTVASDLMPAKIGQETDIVVNIARELDFAGAIEISLAGAPESVQCPSLKSIHGTDTAKKVTLKLQASQAFQGPVELIATSVEEPSKRRLAQSPGHKPLWLSVP